MQAVGIGLFVAGQGFGIWLRGAVLLGLGTALVYSILLAVISNVAHPEWRASAVGAYRLWRDDGYAVGALLARLLADVLSASRSPLPPLGGNFSIRRGRRQDDA